MKGAVGIFTYLSVPQPKNKWSCEADNFETGIAKYYDWPFDENDFQRNF